MLLKKWEELPLEMQTESVKKYYDILKTKTITLVFKRIIDIITSLLMIIILSPLFLILAIVIKIDTKGPVFYRQERITQYNKRFEIFKFRSMVQNADKGLQLTMSNDMRVTRVGQYIRRIRLDEIGQLFNVLKGEMTFVGTRPEVPKYVEQYAHEMMATLLLPAGITNLACIYYKNEAKLLYDAEDIEKTYVEKILPGKMYYNLKMIEGYSFWKEIEVIFMTVLAVCGKEYIGENIPIQETVENKEETIHIC